MKSFTVPVILAGCLWAAPLRAEEMPAAESSAAAPSAQPTALAPAAEIATLAQEVAALRQQLRQNTAAVKSAGAGTATDALLAEQVTLTESLLLKERRLKRLTFEQREAQPGGEAAIRRELQQALAQAESAEARAALLARHRAYQKALATEKAPSANLETSSAAPTP
jgi:hypothetical protein